MAELDKIRTELMNGSAIIIQRYFRGHKARKDFIKRKKAVITLQVKLFVNLCICSNFIASQLTQELIIVYRHAVLFIVFYPPTKVRVLH